MSTSTLYAFEMLAIPPAGNSPAGYYFRPDDGFDWILVLKSLISGAVIATDQEEEWLSVRANSWPTCACGQLCKKLPRCPISNEPLDVHLQVAGKRFSECINEGDYYGALVEMENIERRTADLLARQ